MRRVRTVVLPVPAPATMSSGPVAVGHGLALGGESPSRMRSYAVSAGAAMPA